MKNTKKFLLVVAVLLSLSGSALADDAVPTPTDVCPPACSVVGLEFLGPNQNLNPANYNQVVSGTGDLVFRDGNDDFFLNGRHILLPEFKVLVINASWIARNSTKFLKDVVGN